MVVTHVKEEIRATFRHQRQQPPPRPPPSATGWGWKTKLRGLSLLQANHISNIRPPCPLLRSQKSSCLTASSSVAKCFWFTMQESKIWSPKLHSSVKALFTCWMIRESISSLQPPQITSSVGSTQPISCSGDLEMFPSGKDKTTNPFAHRINWNCYSMPKDKYYVSRVSNLLQARWSHMAFHRTHPSISQFRRRCPGLG